MLLRLLLHDPPYFRESCDFLQLLAIKDPDPYQLLWLTAPSIRIRIYRYVVKSVLRNLNYFYASGSDFWQVTVPASYLDHKKQSIKKLKKILPFLIVIFYKVKIDILYCDCENLRFNFIPVPGSAKVHNKITTPFRFHYGKKLRFVRFRFRNTVANRNRTKQCKVRLTCLEGKPGGEVVHHVGRAHQGAPHHSRHQLFKLRNRRSGFVT